MRRRPRPAKPCAAAKVYFFDVSREVEPGFAIIRIDLDVRDDEDRVTVKRVVRSQQLAESEVARLNGVNADKGCRYFWQYTRIDR
jgi:hypothetical protein